MNFILKMSEKKIISCEKQKAKTEKKQFDWTDVHFTEQNSAAKRTLIFYLNAAQSFNQSDRCWKKFYSGK